MIPRRRLLPVLCAAFAGATLVLPGALSSATPTTTEHPYAFVREFPAPTQHFVEPSDIAVTPGGEVLVADSYYKRVLRYSSAGSLVTSYAITATETPALDIPTHVAAAPDGSFYVAVEDWMTFEFRIIHCSPAGSPLYSWSSRGLGPDQFDGTIELDMSVDTSGNLAVLDAAGGRVKRFSPTGAYLGSVGSQGGSAGQLNSPRALTVDGSGTVWVADSGNSRLQGFFSNGTSLTVETTYQASSIEATPGRLYFDDPFGAVSCVATDGTLLTKVTSAGGYGIPSTAMALDPGGGNLYVCGGDVYLGPPFAQVAVFFSAGLTPTAQWRSWGAPGAQLMKPGDIAVGPSGMSYVAIPASDTIKTFNSSGTLTGTFGSSGTGPGQFTDMGAISVDATGNVYVVDGDRVQIFDSGMGYESEIALPAGLWATDIDVDAAGRLYAADYDADRIRVFEGSTEVTSWGVGGNGEGQLNGPGSLALTRDGYIWVSDVYRVAKFSVTGTYTGTYVADHLSSSTYPIAVDSAGRPIVYVANGEEMGTLLRYRSDGTGAVRFGERGFGPLEFAGAWGMDFGPTGDLLVADTYNDRIQQLAPLADTLPPVTEASGWLGTWVPWTISIDLTAVDGCSGVAFTRYSTSGATSTPETTYAGNLNISAEGTTAVSFYSVDASGHVESSHTVYALRDYTWPLITPSVSEGAEVSGATTITLTANDSMSGVAWIDWKLDGGSVTRVNAASAQVRVAGAGWHTVQYKTSDNAGNVWPDFDDVMFKVNATSGELAGSNRFITAVNISQAAYPGGAQTVVLASGRAFPDALSAAALAGAYDGPLLLCEPMSLPSDIGNEITRLDAERVIVVGGPSTVATSVLNAAKAKLTGTAEATRVAGLDRYETSKAIFDAFKLRYAFKGTPMPGTVFVADGTNYPDALAAAPLAAYKGWPILLTRPANLPAPTLAAIRDNAVTDAIVVGGTTAVSGPVFTQLGSELGSQNTTRLAGNNRYQTALAIVGRAETEGLHWDGVCIATGTNYADALAGGPLAAKLGTFVALTAPTSLNPDLQAKLTQKKASC